MKMWTVKIKDQTTRSVQSDLDLHCPQNVFSSSIVREELKTPSNLSMLPVSWQNPKQWRFVLWNVVLAVYPLWFGPEVI